MNFLGHTTSFKVPHTFSLHTCISLRKHNRKGALTELNGPGLVAFPQRKREEKVKMDVTEIG